MQKHFRGSHFQRHGTKFEAVRRCSEIEIKVVGQWSVAGILQMAIVIRKISIVALGQRCEMNIRLKIVEIGFEGSLAIVVIELAIGELRVPNGKIEYAPVAATLAGGSSGKIILPLLANLHVHDGMIDEEFLQFDLVTQHRNDLEADRELVGMEQGRLSRTFRTLQSDVVKMSGQSRKLEIQTADFGFATGGLIGLLDNLVESETLKTAASQVEGSCPDKEEKEKSYSPQSPAHFAFCAHDNS